MEYPARPRYSKLTSVRKEFGVNIFETILVNNTLRAFLSIKNRSENTRKRNERRKAALGGH